MDHAMGMPHNPAFLPFPFFDFQQDMNLLQRIINTVSTNVFEYVVRFR
jgi:hypothetical protein